MDELNTSIEIICRQTTYSQEEAIDKLRKYNNDIQRIIKEYLGYKPKSPTQRSLNQKIYSEIGSFMEGVHKQYNDKVEAQQKGLGESDQDVDNTD